MPCTKNLPVIEFPLLWCHKSQQGDRVAIREIKKLAVAKARHTGAEEDDEVRKAFTKLSVLLMRGNAAILANCIPTLDDAGSE